MRKKGSLFYMVRTNRWTFRRPSSTPLFGEIFWILSSKPSWEILHRLQSRRIRRNFLFQHRICLTLPLRSTSTTSYRLNSPSFRYNGLYNWRPLEDFKKKIVSSLGCAKDKLSDDPRLGVTSLLWLPGPLLR